MKTLLIVEDEKLIRQSLKAMVQKSGVPVDNILECGNGEAALEVLRMQEVDVMFTDICMPVMDGITLVQSMQELPHVPLTVTVSGYDNFSYAVEMMRMGVRDYILKPVDGEKLKDVLQKLNAEVMAGKESARRDKKLGRAQLRHALLNKNLTETERHFLTKQYGDSLFSGEYLVVLTNDRESTLHDTDEGRPYIYLNAVDGNEVYITDKEYLPVLLKTEASNRYAGVSRCHTGLETLKEAYREALLSRKEAFYLNKEFVRYEEMLTGKKAALHLEETSVKQIVQLFGTDKYEDGLRRLRRIFKNAALSGYAPQEMERMIQTLLDGVLTTYAKAIKTDRDEIKDYYMIYSYCCLEEFETQLMGWLSGFCDTLNRRFNEHKNKQKIQQAVSYIKENYNKDLNMAVVSNHISMNYSLFSYAFKQYTGKNFVNFLKEIRIEEAKKLLEKTDRKVIDISILVGYDNEKHFMKIFKAVCGVSPTEYRKNMQYKNPS